MNQDEAENWGDVFVVAGSTASGKSSLAVHLAEKWDAEIISADAYQIYRGLPILTAQPDQELLARSRHHLIGLLDPVEIFSPADFARMARSVLAEIRARGKRIVVAGGAGFYLQALFDGLPDTPPPNADVREKLAMLSHEEQTVELGRLDPLALETIDLKNPRRVQRALEICLSTGRPFTSFGKKNTASVRGIVLEIPTEVLHTRIERRTHAMLENGAIEEVGRLKQAGPTCAKAIGLREIGDFLTKKISMATCEERIIIATRQYAKRQRTWFRNRSVWEQITPERAEEIQAF